ncbi:MAG: PKD domain-containing protein [Verrucomicrobia bacterium]|nr:PKD domain-containing protein [Verrucomicrobiota bacterium]
MKPRFIVAWVLAVVAVVLAVFIGRPLAVRNLNVAPAQTLAVTEAGADSGKPASQDAAPATPPTPKAKLPPAQETLWKQPPAEPPFAAFADWTRRHAAAPDAPAKAALEAEGVALARARLTALAGLIVTQPERALELAVPQAVRRAVPASVQAWLEETVNARGDYEVLCALPAPGQPHRHASLVRVAKMGGDTHQVFTFGPAADYLTRTNVPLHGIAVPFTAAAAPPESLVGLLPGKLLALHPSPARLLDAGEWLAGRPTVQFGGQLFSFDTLAEAETWAASATDGAQLDVPQTADFPTAASSYTEGRKRFLLMRVDFPDYTLDVFPTNNAVLHLRDMSNFLGQVSYYKHIIAPVGDGSDVTPIMRLTNAAAAYDNAGLSKLYPEARAAAQSVYGYDLTQYDFFLVCTDGKPSYNYAGLGYVGGVGYHLANGYFDVRTSAHEFGHNLGLGHANWWDTGGRSTLGPGVGDEYGDDFDTMGGSGGGVRHFSASFKNRLGWIPNSDALTVSTSGTYRLHAHDLASAPAGLRALRLNRPSGDPYWLEFRQLWTGNKTMMNGINFRWAAGTSLLLDMNPNSAAGKDDHSLTIGRTFSDPALNGHVTVLGKAHTYPESVDVAIHLGPFPTNQAPTVVAAASPLSGSAGQTIRFTASASDPNGDALACFWDFGDGDFSVDNNVVTTHSFAAAGEYYVAVTVSDMKGGTARDAVTVRIGTPATYSIRGRVLTTGNLPVSGVRVAVDRSHYAFSESDGAYAITRLAAGSYTVEANDPTYGTNTYAHPFFSNPVTLGPTNFASADFLAIPASLNLYTKLISAGAVWKYLDDGTDQGAGWSAPGFNDASWSSGPAILGYGQDNEATVLSYGADSANKHLTYYFRRTLTVTSPASYANLLLEVLRDDGVVVYINGSEVFRDNLPGGAVNYLTRALAAVEPDAYLQKVIPATALTPGANTVAVEIHQADPGSSDVNFDLVLSGLNAAAASALNVVYLASPASAQSFTSPTNVTFSAVAQSGGSPVTRMEFYADGAKLGEDAGAPFSLVWTNPPLGAHTLLAVAALGSSSATSAPVEITVALPATNRPRGVWLTAPADGATVPLPGPVPLRADAVAGGTLGVSRVEFFADGVKVGEATQSPFTAAWNEPLSGAHTVLALATDTAGSSITSAPVNVTVALPPSGTALISFGDVWKYLDDGSDQGTNWTARSFNDRAWLQGAARLGYGGDGEHTVVSYGTNAATKFVTTYFRKAFVVANPAAFSRLRLQVRRDDGAVVHLNGVEVWRDNLLPGWISFNSLALASVGGTEETTPVAADLDVTGLVAGTNVVAVEIHQASIDSSDLGFDLELTTLVETNLAAGLYLASPANGAHFNAPAQISFSVGVGAAETVSVVEYFAGSNPIGQATTAPYPFTWSDPPQGVHVLTARAAGGTGLAMTSPPVVITVGSPPPPITPVFELCIPAWSDWKFWDNVAPVAANWAQPGFDDGAWPSGVARFGWGYDGERTLLTDGRITHYFRRWFTVANVALFNELIFQLARDDGAVVYLNGREVFRSNLPGGAVTASTLAATTVNTPDETTFFETAVPLLGSAFSLTTGSNLVAVELHQGSATSSDAGFDLQLVAAGTTEPRVYFSSPANGAVYSLRDTVPLSVLAWAGSGATVRQVEFLVDGVKLGESLTPPYRYDWSNLPPRVHLLTARAVDSRGSVLVSEPVSVTVALQTATNLLIASNSVWKYLDNGSNLGTNWSQLTFNDAAWASGAARLGYGNDGEATPVSYGGNANAKFITTYFRRAFVPPAGLTFTNLIVKLVRDDGAVVWLNGRELFRSNMPTNAIGSSTMAASTVNGTGEQTFFVTNLPSTHLRAGTNVLAVEVHQAAANSTDLGFNLELSAISFTDDASPVLVRAEMEDGYLVLSWPAPAYGYRLYSSPNLAAPASAWTPVTNGTVEVNNRIFVTVPPDAPAQLFRLGKP